MLLSVCYHNDRLTVVSRACLFVIRTREGIAGNGNGNICPVYKCRIIAHVPAVIGRDNFIVAGGRFTSLKLSDNQVSPEISGRAVFLRTNERCSELISR